MGEFPRDIVGKNIKSLRDYLDLTLDEFSNYADISKTSLVNIESGLSNYSTNLLDSVLKFVDYEWHEIINQDFTIKPILRTRLITKHPTLNLETRFKKEPSGRKAIVIAVADGHFEKPLTRLEIIEMLFNKYGWKFPPNSISKALVRSLPLLKRVPKSNERGYQYQTINNGK